MLTASLIFLLTITLVIWQPKGLGVGWSAVFGAVLALIFGVVHLSDIPLVWQIIWNATGTFVALIVISLLLDERGSLPGRRCMWPVGAGSGRKLFAYMVLLGALVSAFVRQRRGSADSHTHRDFHAAGVALFPRRRHWRSSWVPVSSLTRRVCRW